jgi:hypothetical protein
MILWTIQDIKAWERLTTLGGEKSKAVEQALHFSLGLEP